MTKYGSDGRMLPQQQMQPISHAVLEGVTAAAAGGTMLVLSALTLAGTVIALSVATPLLVIFSPVLVPAAAAAFLLAAGFLTSGGLGAAALSALSWMYMYLAGKRPPGAEQMEQAGERLACKARDMKESAQHRVVEQATQ